MSGQPLPDNPFVTAIIPAHNEADRVGQTAQAARRAGADQVIVVDDASTDGTAEAARAAGADEVITLSRRAGKGGALNAVLPRAQGGYLLLLDADLGECAGLAETLVAAVRDGRCGMAVALFPELAGDGPRRGGGFGLAQAAARGGIRRLTGADFRAPLCGQRALDRRVVEGMGGFFPGFGVETALSGWAAAGGWRVLEIPLSMTHRRTGKTLRGLLHRARQFADICRALLWLVTARSRARAAGKPGV